MQMRADQRFVGKYAAPHKVDDWLENHPEALVTKCLVEGPRRGGNGIGRVHEKQSSRPASSGPIQDANAPSGSGARTRRDGSLPGLVPVAADVTFVTLDEPSPCLLVEKRCDLVSVVRETQFPQAGLGHRLQLVYHQEHGRRSTAARDLLHARV